MIRLLKLFTEGYVTEQIGLEWLGSLVNGRAATNDYFHY